MVFSSRCGFARLAASKASAIAWVAVGGTGRPAQPRDQRMARAQVRSVPCASALARAIRCVLTVATVYCYVAVVGEYTLAELASAAGKKERTVRYYQQIGLLRQPGQI